MFHLIWYILIGLISGVVAKSVMHVHIAIFWTIVLGIIGSILGGAVTHMFLRPRNPRFHPAGLIFPPWARSSFSIFAINSGFNFPKSIPYSDRGRSRLGLLGTLPVLSPLR